MRWLVILALLLGHDFVSLGELVGHVVGRASSEEDRIQALLAAWATTGSCNASRFYGRCGVIAALQTPDNPDPIVAQAAAGAALHPNASAVFSAETLFEIASNTKVFTAIVLQRLVEQGNISMKTTLRSLLPPIEFKNASVGTITMQELVTHTSGLPILPPNMHCDGCSNPFTGYTAHDLYECLANLSSLPTRGSFKYSNFGFGLLGYVLELQAKMPYEDLTKWALLTPLGMKRTKIVLTDSEWVEVAIGLNEDGKFAERRGEYGVLKGQGAFHSSVSDMATFLAAHLAISNGQASQRVTPALARALQMAAEPLAPDEFTAQHGHVASGWQLYSANGAPIVWKSGSTEGYGSFTAWNSESGRAAVALSSCGNCASKGVDQLVRLLVDEPPRETPLTPPPPAATLLPYTGCFMLPAMVDENHELHRNASLVTVTLTRGQMSIEVDGSGAAALVPFPRPPSPGIASLGFAFDQSQDSICLMDCIRRNVQDPLELANVRHGRRELYYLSQETPDQWAQFGSLALHVDGWDLFAPRVPCPGSHHSTHSVTNFV